MLLEVVISALLVGLIAIGTFTGLEGAQRASSDARAHAEATKFAQQDEERLRGLSTTKLAELAESGSQTTTEKIGTVTFTITSSVSFASAAKNSLSCETTAAAANYLQTTSSVRWTGLSASRPAVRQSSILGTFTTGLLVRVKNQNEEPVAGATVTLTGADSATQITPVSGCVLFVALKAGAVTVAVSKAGWVEVNGKTTGTSKSATVVTEKTETSDSQLAEPGAIRAEFESNLKTVGVKGDTFVALQAGIAEPDFFVGGTAGAYAEKVTTETTLFPFAKAKVYEPYTVYAGDCTANNPETVTAAGEKLKPREAKVEPNVTSSLSGGTRLEIPEVKIKVWEGTKEEAITKKTNVKLITAPESAEIINTACKGKTSQNHSAGVSYKHKVEFTAGGELTEGTRGQPYAKELQFCVQAKVGKFDYRYESAQFESKVKAGTALKEVFLKEQGTKGGTEATLLPCP